MLGDTVELGGGEVSADPETSEIGGVTVPEDYDSGLWHAAD